MKQQSVPTDGLLLFQAHFDQQLNLVEHPLIKLARQIDRGQCDRQFGEHYCEDTGAPAKPTRLMAVEQKHVSQRELKQGNVAPGNAQRAHQRLSGTTDAKLSYQAIVKLAGAAKQRGIPLRRSYLRVAKNLPPPRDITPDPPSAPNGDQDLTVRRRIGR